MSQKTNNDLEELEEDDVRRGCVWAVIIFIYIFMFLIGPWHYYNELRSREKHGKFLRDYVSDVVYLKWLKETFKACLIGRIDGEIGSIFIEIYNPEVMRRSLGGYGDDYKGKYRNVIKLARSEYDKGCSIRSDNFAVVTEEYNIGVNYYNFDVIGDSLYELPGDLFFLQVKPDYQGGGRDNYFGVYDKTLGKPRLAWFSLQGVYHKKVDPGILDYALALFKDFVTMPLQWVRMIIYVVGGH